MPRTFWTNLTHNLGYFFVGRYAGLVAYFFPAVFALLAFLAAPRGGPPGSGWCSRPALAQIVLLRHRHAVHVDGGGGSVGNRYFIGGLRRLPVPAAADVAIAGRAFVPWASAACSWRRWS